MTCFILGDLNLLGKYNVNILLNRYRWNYLWCSVIPYDNVCRSSTPRWSRLIFRQRNKLTIIIRGKMIRPSFQSALVLFDAFLSRETKFHQMKRSPNGSPPSIINVVGSAETSTGSTPLLNTSICPAPYLRPENSIEPLLHKFLFLNVRWATQNEHSFSSITWM